MDDPWEYHPRNRTEEGCAEVAEIFRSLCDKAAEYDVCVGIEGAAGHVCYDVAALKRCVDEIDRDNLRVIFDLFNFLDADNVNRYKEILKEGIEAFKGRIECFHIKDWRMVDQKVEQCRIGEGEADFKYIVETIRAYDSNAVLILEGTVGCDIKPAVEILRQGWKKHILARMKTSTKV